MKYYPIKLLCLLCVVLGVSNFGFSQDSLPFDFEYEVHRVYPSPSITKEKLVAAHTLIDLNKHYKPAWVRSYISVELSTSQNGKIKKSVSENDTLSQAQKEDLKLADVNTIIGIKVNYIPENTLKQNDPKEFNFTFTVDPDREATYASGKQQLQKYLKDNAIDKISKSQFRQHHATALKFAINEDGQVVDAQVFESSKDEEVDTILLEAICNMPNWKPAEYANGLRVKQEFALTVGDHKSCVMNLLNIRKKMLGE